MDKRNLRRITWGFAVLAVLVVALMLISSLSRTSRITLPESSVSSEQQTEENQAGTNMPTVVEVTPQTVQAAIATLERPEEYRRSVTVEQFWNNGSGMYEIMVAVREGWTRTDRTMPDGRIRHTVTDGNTTYIWYNNQVPVRTITAGEISADDEQTIPTYETVLELPVNKITIADYRTLSDVNCIYLETEEDADGYFLRYWVNVDTGLLVAAEKLLDGETVYRMAALSVEQAVPDEADFILPDGTRLLGE